MEVASHSLPAAFWETLPNPADHSISGLVVKLAMPSAFTHTKSIMMKFGNKQN